MDSLVLYYFENCPFCIKVRRFLNENNVNIELKEIKQNLKNKQELINQGGSSQVPCLNIKFYDSTDNWLYESDEIIKYLTYVFSIKK